LKENYFYFFHLSISKFSFLALFTVMSYASVQCKTQENKEQIDSDLPKNERMISIQQDTLRTETLNKSKTFLLKVEKIISAKRPMATINYAVYETKTQKCIKKDSYQGVDVMWNDSTSLKLIPYIGMERKPVSENPNEIPLTKTPNEAIIIKLNDSL
jgi:hypothetical protein